MSTSFSLVPGLNRLCSRSASQQMESVLPLPAEWSIRYFLPDVARRGKVRRDVIVGHLPHHAALVIAREDGEGRALRLVLLRLALGHADEEERERLEQLVLRQHFAVKELDRVFASASVGVFVSPVLCQRKFSSRRGSVAAITSLVSAAR